MKLIDKIESRERCTEAGWDAYDYLMDEPVDRGFILSLRPLGSFVFLDMLAKPFFKIESDHFLIKGIMGDPFFRVAHHREDASVCEHLEELLSGYDNRKEEK